MLEYFIIWFLRLLNKKGSENQAHVYTPAERKPKLEEPFRNRDKTPEKHTSVEPENLITTKQSENYQQGEELMDFELNTNSTTIKNEPTVTSVFQENLVNDSKTVDKIKETTLTNEDIISFKNSVSYVSKNSVF